MGLLTDWLIDRSRANRAKQDKLNETQAQVYLEAIKSGRLAGNPEALDYANQQVEKLLGTKGKGQKGGAGGPSDSKSLFQRFGQIVHTLHGHGPGGAQPQGQQQMGSVGPPPPAASPVEGDEAAPAAKDSASPIPPPPSFSSIASQAFPSPDTLAAEKTSQDVTRNKALNDAEMEQRKGAAATAGLAPGSPEFQEFMSTGKYPSLRFPSTKTYVGPDGKTFTGTPGLDGRITDVDTQQVVPGATAVTGSMLSAPQVKTDNGGVPYAISRNGKTLTPDSPEWTDTDQKLLDATKAAYEKGEKDKAALSAKRQSYFGSLPQGVLLKKDDPAKGLKAGELAFVSRTEAADHPDKYAPPAQGDQALLSNARFGEIQQTVDYVNDAIDKLPDEAWDEKSRAQLAYYLRSPNPSSAINQFLKGEAGTTLSQAQQDYVTALASMVESAQAMTSLQGIGQRGSDKMRATIAAMLPTAATPSRSYAKRQMKLFQAEMDQLKKGVPSLGGLTGGGNFKNNPPPTAPGAPPRDAAGYLEYLKNKKAANASNTTAP
jgi:hypothetical protein